MKFPRQFHPPRTLQQMFIQICGHPLYRIRSVSSDAFGKKHPQKQFADDSRRQSFPDVSRSPESFMKSQKQSVKQFRFRQFEAARRQLTICETAVAKLEKELAALDEAMAANACDAGKLNELFTQKQETEARLEQEMSRWEELSLSLEES